jgi:hypothetical protein
MTGVGHHEAFLRPRPERLLSFQLGDVRETRGNAREAPKPARRWTAMALST